jgi:hypothetical protein
MVLRNNGRDASEQIELCHQETGFLLTHHFAILLADKRIKDDARHYVSIGKDDIRYFAAFHRKNF